MTTTSGRWVSRRSTYLAMTSTSRLTTSPTPLWPNVVRSERGRDQRDAERVVTDVSDGERHPVDGDRALLDDVCRQAGGSVKSTVSQRSPGVRAVMVAVPSTWPCTTWPPKRPSAGIARSRLTRSPGGERAQAAAGERLGHDVDRETGRVVLGHGQADAVDGDGGAVRRVD